MIRVNPQSASVRHEAPMHARGLSPHDGFWLPPPGLRVEVGTGGWVGPTVRVTVMVITPGREEVDGTGLLPTLAHFPLTQPSWPSQSFSVLQEAPVMSRPVSISVFFWRGGCAVSRHTKAVSLPYASGDRCRRWAGSGSDGGTDGGRPDRYSGCCRTTAGANDGAFAVDASQLTVAVIFSLARGA